MNWRFAWYANTKGKEPPSAKQQIPSGQINPPATGVTLEMIEAAKTPNGGWTKRQLAAWGVPWPPPKGWKEAIATRLPPSVKDRSPQGQDPSGLGLKDESLVPERQTP